MRYEASFFAAGDQRISGATRSSEELSGNIRELCSSLGDALGAVQDFASADHIDTSTAGFSR